MKDDFGVDPGLVNYSKRLLDNANFKILCIYNAGIENVLKRKISISEYIIYKNILEGVVASNNNVMNIDSFILKSFSINPSILPVSYKQQIMAIDEFSMATEIVVLELKNASGPKGYITYEEYYNYMLEKAKTIIEKLHDKGFYNTQKIERLTLLCTAYKLGLQSVDTFYRSPNKIVTTSLLTDDTLKKVQEEMFSMMLDNDSIF
jgi:hypothetical protein